ncbi:SUMF1/EgtB/PvdO family nonheme iron enzyme [uncultured Thiodictyon sp.]|uniref:SUMF1/EgtB/PvdO family nonheme iron enzyme n=1 Tax=uncultured Thiodictyon sp. TaxID=1846217 RepID=UPI0025D72150|nr:SUMF1/EgtB/PvdO family nonheme iron enzyme [uncultured Thiodictyon sp.]
MLDGLDEAPDAHDHRAQIKHVVEDFAAVFSRCRFLITSRTYAYQRQEWRIDGFAEVSLRPFRRGQVRDFADAWYAHMVELLRLPPAAARDRAEVLTHTVARNERIRELADRPLLLTLIAQLQTEGGAGLPERREEIYDKAVEMLLTKWETMKVRERADGTKEIEPSLAEWLNAGRNDIRRQLNRLAFAAHRDQPELTGTADIRQETLICALLAAGTPRADLNVGLLERYLRDRAGILAFHGVGMYRFPDRSIQEYLAACHLTDDEFPDQLAYLARADPNRWREVTLLASAKAARGSSLSAWAVADTLCPAPPPNGPPPIVDHWGGLLAGCVLVECGDLAKVAARNEDKLVRVRDWQSSILRGAALPATERALAGCSLTVLGDPRPEVMTLDGMQFCLVPSGPFVMGDAGGLDDERPQHSVDLAYPYVIGRFPVTLAQWREYVRLSGRLPDNERNLGGRDNDPVLYVSWHDAMGFCRFLSQAWQGLLPPGFVVTLPSEPEWEKAARGGEQVPVDGRWVTSQRLNEELVALSTWTLGPNPAPRRAYPWGDSFDADLANLESIIGETSVIGCYPAGRSPYGCEEMTGNVGEWTRSLWGKYVFSPEFSYPYDPTDSARERLDARSDVLRVVRGGSWRSPRGQARCAARTGHPPDTRIDTLGFRVVLRLAPIF